MRAWYPRPPPVRIPARAAGRRAIAGASPALPPGAPAVPPASVGEIDFGLRVSGVSGDPARYQRLRDLRDGPTLDRLRYDRDTAGWKFQAAMDHVGYRDQRYQATFDHYGDVKGSVEWNQIPLFYSTGTRTPFRSESSGRVPVGRLAAGGDTERHGHDATARAGEPAVHRSARGVTLPTYGWSTRPSRPSTSRCHSVVSDAPARSPGARPSGKPTR